MIECLVHYFTHVLRTTRLSASDGANASAPSTAALSTPGSLYLFVDLNVHILPSVGRQHSINPASTCGQVNAVTKAVREACSSIQVLDVGVSEDRSPYSHSPIASPDHLQHYLPNIGSVLPQRVLLMPTLRFQ